LNWTFKLQFCNQKIKVPNLVWCRT